jgi:hypothetical protein
VTSSSVERERFIAAIGSIEELDAAFRQQIDLSEKLLKGLRFIGAISAAALPHGKLLLSAAYVLIGSYVVLIGADYVDAPRMRLLDRAPGLPQVVAASLSGDS